MNTMKKKILFFVKNISMLETLVFKLHPYLHNCEILVFHNSKMQPGKKQTEVDINNIDVSCLTYSEIKQLLKEWHPDVCVLYNFRGIIDQFFIRICKACEIKTYFLAHGILSDDILTIRKISSQGLWLRIKRISWQLKQYYSLIRHSCSPINELKIFIQVLVKNDFAANPFDKYFVYGDRCLNFLSKFYKLKKNENAFTVGYPLFDSETQKELSVNTAENIVSKGVLYVHQPFILDNYAKISYEEERAFILKMANKLLPTYGNFTIMLHPREDIKHYESLYEGTTINVIQSPNDYRLFVGAQLVLGHYSTALLFALYFDKPTFIIDYPTLKTPTLFKDIFLYSDTKDFSKPVVSNSLFKNKSFLLGEGNSFEHISNIILNSLDH